MGLIGKASSRHDAVTKGWIRPGLDCSKLSVDLYIWRQAMTRRLHDFNGGLPASCNFLFSASLFFFNFAGCTK